MDTFYTIVADYVFVIVVFASAYFMLRIKQDRAEMFIRGLAAGVTSLVVGQLSGLFYFHERPFVALDVEAGALAPAINSFPSQHALLVFAAAFVVWFATKKWQYGLPLVLLAGAVGWARVMTQVHWPIDIIGSFVIVLICTWVWFKVPLPKWLHNFGHKIDATVNKYAPKMFRTNEVNKEE